MHYALTGATGFVGGALARRLVADGHRVTAVVRDPARAGLLHTAGVRVLAGDLSDAESLERAFEGADGVFHVAGWYKVGDDHPEQAWEVNVRGTRNALAAAERVRVPRVVHTSTCGVNSDTHGTVVDETYRFTGTHLSVYDETKARAHEIAEAFAAEHARPEVVIVMPGGIYGPRDTSQSGQLARDVVARRRVAVPRTLRMMQAHIDDVVTGHVLAMDRGEAGESYILAGERTDLHTMLTLLADVTGGRPPVAVPGALLPPSQRVLSVLGRVTRLPASYTAEALRVAEASYWASPAKAQADLGWTFRPLVQGLRDTAVTEGWIAS